PAGICEGGTGQPVSLPRHSVAHLFFGKPPIHIRDGNSNFGQLFIRDLAVIAGLHVLKALYNRLKVLLEPFMGNGSHQAALRFGHSFA
ncbi:MAG: hypothetical protein WCO56_11215, partial [Verrucomicrobiota bacterium]